MLVVNIVVFFFGSLCYWFKIPELRRILTLNISWLSTAVGNPMDAGSLAQTSGGPGGLSGSAFASNMGTDSGPGGLAGGTFYVGTDSSGPGGFAGKSRGRIK